MCADQAETTHSQQHSSSVNNPLITVPWMGQSAKNKSSWRPKLWTGESARVCVQPSPHLKREAHNAQPRRSGSRTKLNFSSHPPTPHDGRQSSCARCKKGKQIQRSANVRRRNTQSHRSRNSVTAKTNTCSLFSTQHLVRRRPSPDEPEPLRRTGVSTLGNCL